MRTIEIKWNTDDVIMQADAMNIELTEEQADDILESLEISTMQTSVLIGM